MDKDLEDDPRVIALADQILPGDPLGVNLIIGGLYRLWRYCDTHLRYDALQGTLHTLSRVTALPVTVLEIFPSEWLIINADGTVTFPRYSEKNALFDKDMRREQTRKRVAAWRERQRMKSNALLKRNGGVTERYKSVTTGTGTETSETGTVDAPLASAGGRLAGRDQHTLDDARRQLQAKMKKP